jgi:hypothetical protein
MHKKERFNMKTLIATFAITTSASAGIVTFDNINPPAPTDQTSNPGVQLTMDVDGFAFTSTNTYYGDHLWYYYTYCPAVWNSGTALSIGIRGTTAIFSGYYQNAAPTYNVSRSDGSLWAFNKAYFTALWSTGAIHLVGLRGGVEVFNFTQSISNTQQTMVSLSSYPGPINRIDTLKITNESNDLYGRRNFIMDDMFYTLPAPGALAIIGLAVCGTSNRRRKDSNV